MPEGKVIPYLQKGPQIEAALERLAHSRTEEESRAPLRDLASYGNAALPIVLRHLGTANPWMVRALGRVLSQLPDRRRATEALRRAILDEDSTDRRRIVAMVLLDQFLGQPLDDALFAALGNPTEVAIEALLRESPPSEHSVRLDYLSIVHAQSLPEILYALERFRHEGSLQSIEALRFSALDEREEIAQPAIEALGTVRQVQSLWALQVLEPNVPTFRRSLVQRMQRKLLLSGVPDEPLPDPPVGARVLVSPIDGAGNRLFLFLFPEGEGYRVLHLFVDDEDGMRGAYEVSYEQGELPPCAPIGTPHPAPHPWEGIFLLESSWGYARRLLKIALAGNEVRETFYPQEYRFFCNLVWGWSAPEDDKLPIPELGEPLSQRTASMLLGHSFLASWFLESEAIYQAARGLRRFDFTGPDGQGQLALVTISLVQNEFPPLVCLQYVRRLRDTSEWLVRAGERYLGAIARAAADELDTGQATQSIFALMLMQKGVLIALGNMRQGREREAGA